MSERNKEQCIVLLPSGPHFERLFEEVLENAVRNTGLVPSRLYWNAFSPTPIHLFVDQIERAEALVADVSEHTEEIWLAIGCAVALGKPLCLISCAPEEANVPLGIQYLPHIPYPVDAFPRDYIELQKKIYAQLSAIMPQWETSQPELSHQHPIPPSSSISPFSEDLASYEVNALKRRRFIETKPVQVNIGNELHLSENLFLTRTGEDWLSRHGKKATAQRTIAHSRARFISTR